MKKLLLFLILVMVPTTGNCAYDLVGKVHTFDLYVGQSADTKPTLVNKGDLALQTDDRKRFVFDGTDWAEINNYTDVSAQDQHTELINLWLSQEIATVTVALNTTLGDTTVRIDSATLPVAGNLLCLKEADAFYQGTIITVTPVSGTLYDVLMDAPVDYAYTTAGGCSIRNASMDVDGSSTIQTFTVGPDGLTAGTNWDIVSLELLIQSASEPNFNTFGDLTALTNGIVIRFVDGTTKNLITAHDNGDLGQQCGTPIYLAKPLYGFSVSCKFRDDHGVVLRLSSDTADTIQFRVRDNLTGLTDMTAIIKGHVVE